MITQMFEHFFKAEVRNAGQALVDGKSVFLRRGADTQIDASIRTSSSLKNPLNVAFRSDSIASSEFSVQCNCAPSLRGQFCKHIWATLLFASETKPDFFEAKTQITKQAAFRKENDERPKARAKNLKKSNQDQTGGTSKSWLQLPPPVQSALEYFATNGFNFTMPLDASALSEAKRTLSRVFHPDKGGSQDEMLELLRHAETLGSHYL